MLQNGTLWAMVHSACCVEKSMGMFEEPVIFWPFPQNSFWEENCKNGNNDRKATKTHSTLTSSCLLTPALTSTRHS